MITAVLLAHRKGEEDGLFAVLSTDPDVRLTARDYAASSTDSAPEHAGREDELPRNVTPNVKTAAPRPRRFRP